jgi:S-adenosylmethionine:tRNA ribosyltransferase-isomerase
LRPSTGFGTEKQTRTGRREKIGRKSGVKGCAIMSLFTRDYDYGLPEALIARWPLERREDSRMLVLHRAERRIEHRSFTDFASYLREGDRVVLNDTKVIPARVMSDDGKIELLFLEQTGTNIWKCLVKPGKKMRAGHSVTVGGNRGEVREILRDGERLLAFDSPVDLEKVGRVPLPPYMEREAAASDVGRYQTVYARTPGAVAAPTAGLHFTPELLQRIPHTFVTLHVGVGTFKPVQVDEITSHPMHSERFAVSEMAARVIAQARRVVAAGTTTVRVLESCMRRDGRVAAQESSTDIFIYPPFDFRITGALLTNFHLPKSTLLMLVSAFAGREFVMEAYGEAIREEYRFYSYGDCMLIV